MLSPTDQKEWIATQGPYLLHSCSSPAAREKILAKGLIPWNQLGKKTSAWAGTLAEARPGYTYLGTPEFMRRMQRTFNVSSATLIRVDLRQLDPAEIMADEDAFVDHKHGLKPSNYNLSDPRDQVKNFSLATGEDSAKKPYKSYGEWAEAIDLGEDPLMTRDSLFLYGAIAHRGIIASAELEAVRCLGELEDMGQWDHLPIGLDLS